LSDAAVEGPLWKNTFAKYRWKSIVKDAEKRSSIERAAARRIPVTSAVIPRIVRASAISVGPDTGPGVVLESRTGWDVRIGKLRLS
jgi:hypothetical protein